MTTAQKIQERCACPNNNPLMIEYHDKEWGVPVHDDKKLFEFLILEGAQAGLDSHGKQFSTSARIIARHSTVLILLKLLAMAAKTRSVCLVTPALFAIA